MKTSELTRELRLGNFIFGSLEDSDYQEVVKVLAIEDNKSDYLDSKVIVSSTSGTEWYDEFAFIPISETGLIHLGFERKDPNGYTKEIGLFIFDFDNYFNLCIHWGSGHLDEGLDDIIYIHRLQNLIFSLTGEELKYHKTL